MKKKIAVLYGGRSGEHEVSCRSAASVVQSLDASAYSVVLIGIDHDGNWFLQDEAETERCMNGADALSIARADELRVMVVPGGGERAFVSASGKAIPVDLCFPVLHGTFGEDGTVQGLLEMADVPYVGAGVLGSAAGMDKETAKVLWHNAGLPIVPYVCVREWEWKNEAGRRILIDRAEKDFAYPLFVKPSAAGSSVGCGLAEDRAGLESRVSAALTWDSKVLIEPFIPAREIECSVTGNDSLEAYTPGEIVPRHQFYDYDAKYTDPRGADLLIPAELDEPELYKIRELALKAYRTAGISGLARVDFMIHKESGEIFLNEINTMPGFTTISMFAKMCGASGLSYPDLLDLLIRLGEERFALRRKKKFSYNQ